MTDYSELVEALRYCWGDNKYGCGRCPYHLNSDAEGRCPAGLDAAAAIETLTRQVKNLERALRRDGEWQSTRN